MFKFVRYARALLLQHRARIAIRNHFAAQLQK